MNQSITVIYQKRTIDISDHIIWNAIAGRIGGTTSAAISEPGQLRGFRLILTDCQWAYELARRFAWSHGRRYGTLILPE